MDRQTVPIVELVLFGHGTKMPVACLLSWILGLAPHSRSTNIREEPADVDLLPWDLVLLSTDKVK